MNKQKGMLSIVMPAYKEEQCIYQNLLTTCDCVSTFCPLYEIILVNDGSPDATFEEAMRARQQNPHIKIVNYKVNRGKGAAMKEGIFRASGEYIGFLDADLDLSPQHFASFLKELEEEDADIVIGSKMHKDSQLTYPLYRRILSYGYYILIRLLFRLHLKDTQTGIKLFRSDALLPIARELQTTGYAFDIEILARATQIGCRILECPVQLENKRGTANDIMRIHVGDIIAMFFDTLRIFITLRLRGE